MLAKGVGGVSRILAASLVIAGAVTLLIPGESAGLLAAAVASLAIIAVWSVGSAGGPPSGTGNRRNRLHQAISVGFGLSLGVGAFLAAGFADGPGAFGLPRSLWGLVLGVWLIPLAVTSVGFAVSFAPPTPAELARLRGQSRESP